MDIFSIYFVRHAETDWNTKTLIQGLVDIPLNDSGKNQAKALSHYLSSVNFSKIFASDLARAYETASIIAEGRNLPILKDSRLREKNYGSWEGKPLKEFLQATDAEKDEGEPWSEVTKRMWNFLHELLTEIKSGNILVVSHGGALKRLISSMLGITYEELHFFNAGFCRLTHSEGHWRCLELNQVTHPHLEL